MFFYENQGKRVERGFRITDEITQLSVFRYFTYPLRDSYSTHFFDSAFPAAAAQLRQTSGNEQSPVPEGT